MIRDYCEEDCEAVVGVWRTASDLAHPFLPAEFLDAEAENLRNIYLVHAKTWVTEVDGVVVGFIAMIGGEIGGLFLLPKLHGQGLGRSMVGKAIAEFGDLTVEVFKKNTLGVRFYRSCGFVGSDEKLHEPTAEALLQLSLING